MDHQNCMYVTVMQLLLHIEWVHFPPAVLPGAVIPRNPISPISFQNSWCRENTKHYQDRNPALGLMIILHVDWHNSNTRSSKAGVCTSCYHILNYSTKSGNYWYNKVFQLTLISGNSFRLSISSAWGASFSAKNLRTVCLSCTTETTQTTVFKITDLCIIYHYFIKSTEKWTRLAFSCHFPPSDCRLRHWSSLPKSNWSQTCCLSSRWTVLSRTLLWKFNRLLITSYLI